EHNNEKDFNVALCIALESERGDEKLVNDIASIFRRMFGSHEHLDVLFINEGQEVQLRKVCCPFFSSKRFNHPDFYLTSSEGYGLEEIRACYKGRRLMDGHPDGYMICEIDPPIAGQSYGLGEQNISKVIIASRHSGYSLFVIREWPAYVHVARLVVGIPDNNFFIAKNDIVSIGWGELYESSAAAKAGFISH
ncbi:MAG TPA: hypothetical protein VFX02_00705, partial [Gammaproteobacteria bacterium]|nr:hypothetical protein [Gammaproteobacteria bacterium]